MQPMTTPTHDQNVWLTIPNGMSHVNPVDFRPYVGVNAVTLAKTSRALPEFFELNPANFFIDWQILPQKMRPLGVGVLACADSLGGFRRELVNFLKW